MEGEPLKSRPSREAVRLCFLNKTNKLIHIIWVTFNGEYNRYKSLAPNEFVSINTYTRHPWLFIDSETHDRMCVQNSFVFYADYIYKVLLERNMSHYRVPLLITLPVYTLKMRSLLCVRDYLVDVAKVQDLEIPNELKRELERVFNKKITFT